MSESVPYSVNCSILFPDVPLLSRFAMAKDAGFKGVELWWPFDSSIPDVADIDALVMAIEEADVQLTGFNLFAGNMAAGDRGVLSSPDRSAEFRASVATAIVIAQSTGCRCFNALYGRRLEGVDPRVQDDLAVQNLAFAAQAMEVLGGTILVEPVSGMPDFPLVRASQVVSVLDRVRVERGPDNLGLLLDVFHLAENGSDVTSDIEEYADRIAHVQVADSPGRGAPGSGGLPIDAWIGQLRDAGYSGPIGLEYRSRDEAPFSWLSEADRSG